MSKLTKKISMMLSSTSLILGLWNALLVKKSTPSLLKNFLISLRMKKLSSRKRNVAARKRAADKAAADELLNAVASVLTDEFQTIAEVTDRIEGADVTTAKIQYRLNSLVKAGEAEKQEMKVTGADGKKRIVMGYRLSDKPANEAIDK